MNSSVSPRINADLLDEKYAEWKNNPESVDPTWSAFFEGFELGAAKLEQEIANQQGASGSAKTPAPASAEAVAASLGETDPDALRVTQVDPSFRARLVSLVYTYRAVGHTEAWIDPLSFEPPTNPSLDIEGFGFSQKDLDEEVATHFFAKGQPMKLNQMIGMLDEIYANKIGFEFMHINDREVRHWLRDRIEERPDSWDSSADEKATVLGWLQEAELFEAFLHKTYVAQKRFGLDGGESVMVALNGLFEATKENGVDEIVMGMAHRGRLNILANFLHKPLEVIFHEFSENYVTDLAGGDGDVKYHLGFETTRKTKDDHPVKIFLAPNPSHLEAVNPVVEGMTRARQRLVDDTETRTAVLPVLLHGDAAFAGQGPVAEVLNFSQLPGYRTGGTVHIIINNQIGFTTLPEDARSSAYCTDVVKMIEAPVFHVNGDCPLDVLFCAKLALEFRQKFRRDVVIDVVCYRRHGHNEADEPAFTAPQLYRTIRSKKTTATLFKQALIEDQTLSSETVDAMENAISKRLKEDYEKIQKLESEGGEGVFHGAAAVIQPPYSHDPVVTGITKKQLKFLGERLVDVPEGFKLNDKIKRFVLGKRAKATKEGGPFDWGHGEALAFASLLAEGKSVRLSGQDSRRGTFSHRHAVLYDADTRERYFPLKNLTEDQAMFCAYNSLLSEHAVLGFDYGYTLMVPDMLICWEAQFGDFANGAQVIIDQFIASSESKWGKPSGLVMLLPHGYEGQGPEHSSARLERFLQLCAERNMQVCNLTTPAQYFHVLRRQLARPFRKPLIIMTPKSLLRQPDAVSTAADFTGKSCFLEMIDDEHLVDKPERVTRLIFCSGKVYYDLRAYRDEHKLKNVAIIRIEQLYPFNSDRLKQIVQRYPR
ncbi:MAG: 2-oxoglutarate dehydrogenase E1 component, partial [Verrucomicrobiales bacterium]